MEKTIQEFKSEVDGLLAERFSLAEEAKSLNNRLADINRRLKEIDGSWNCSGQLATARHRLGAAELRAADESRAPVVWKSRDAYYLKGDYLVSRVTPRRIYIRERGRSSEIIFNIDGKPNGYWGKALIDAEATIRGFMELKAANRERAAKPPAADPS